MIKLSDIQNQTIPVPVAIGGGQTLTLNVFCHRDTVAERRQMSEISKRHEQTGETKGREIQSLAEERGRLFSKMRELQSRYESLEAQLGMGSEAKPSDVAKQKKLREELTTVGEELEQERDRIEAPREEMDGRIQALVDEGNQAIHRSLAEQVAYIAQSWEVADEAGQAIPLSAEVLYEQLSFRVLTQAYEAINEVLAGPLVTGANTSASSSG